MIDTRVEQSGSVLRVEQSGREVCDSTGRNHVESQNESSAQPGSQNSVLPVGTHQSGVNERCESRTSFLSGSGLAMDGRVAAGSGGAESTHLTPFFLRPAYRFKPQVTIGDDIGHPGRRMRTNLANVRRHVDYVPTQLSLIESRMSERDRRDRPLLQPNILYSMTAYPPAKYKDRPIDCVLSKYLRSAINKVKCPIYDLCWTPEGKRLITGSSTGEFTLWNGTAFNFETILQAHDTAIRALEWSHNRTWLLSADHDGFIKYWQDNMNNVHMFQAHKEAVRSISFAPTDTKLATGGDDGTVRIWDVERCVEERNCRGHGSDVRSVDWHPIKGLVASGSRDSQQPVKIWDPKTATCLATLRDHKNSAMFVEWNKNGNWLLTCSRDHLIKLFDIRMMKELKTFRAHKKEVTALAWHPIHEELFVSGGGDGSMAYWLVNNQKEVGFIENAHDHAIWTLKWHPMGHILASGSNDNNTKFWTRHRPGDALEDFFVSGSAGKTKMAQSVAKEVERVREEEVAGAEAVSEIREGNIPGMGLDGEVLQQMQSVRTHYGVDGRTLFPGDPIFSGLEFRRNNVGAKRTLIKQPPPKKAHRQMERLWTGSTRPVGSSWGDGELGDTEDDSEPSRMERSLLGNAPLQTPDMGPPSPKRNALDPEQAPPYPQINRMESGNQALGVEGGFAPPGPPARPFLPPRPPPGIPPPPEIMMAAAGGMIAPKSEMQCEPPGFFMNNFGPCPPPRLQWPPPMRPPCPDGRNFFDGPPPSDFSQDCPILPNQLGPMWEQSGGAGRNPMRGDQPRPLNPNDPRIQRGLKRGPAAI